jgi:helicase
VEQITELQDTLSRLGYVKLNPMQEGAVKAGLLEPGNFVVSAPTASGKTLLAILRVLDNFKRKNGKAVYIVPLRALASEKHREFSQILSQFGISVGVSTGDLDDEGDRLAAFDLIIATSEKMDSLTRHKAPWLKQVSLVVADETHLLNDAGRGATLEVVLTKFLQNGAQVLSLSATIPNAGELAGWMGAKLFESEWRPTQLVKMVASAGKLYSEDGAVEMDEKKPVHDLVRRAMAVNAGKGQSLVFVSTRRSAEALARELITATGPALSPEDKAQCELLAQKALKALPNPTGQCELLSQCLRSGVAFHHAGIEGRQREIIERGFKETRCIKCIVATTTLAMGIDYPASWVIVRDVKRFDGNFSDFVPALEVAQMLGRAGRPRYDKQGVGVICCGPSDLRKVRDKYILGPLENIFSKLSAEPALRTHALALVATNHCNSFEELFTFFGHTFFAKQFGDSAQLNSRVERVGMELMKYDFMREKGGKLIATPVGKRVSELYIDPLTAKAFIDYIDKPVAGPFPLLLEVAGALELRPLPRVGRAEEQALWEELYAQIDDNAVSRWEFDEDALGKYKQAKIANAWINEAGEDAIFTQFDLPPGILHSRVRLLEWLTYSLAELAYIKNASSVRLEARNMQRRLKHGVKEELLDLVRVRGIGRVRARRLFIAGITNREELRAAGKEKLAKVIGAKVAERVIAGEGG